MVQPEINILIIDDDESLRKVLAEACKRQGWNPILSYKLDEIRSIVSLKPIHAALVDVMIPKINGVELATNIQSSSPNPIKIFLMSGVFRDKQFAADSIKKSGAIDFFFKPFDLEKVMSAIGKAIQAGEEKPKVALHALLSRPLASERERKKALDQIEDISGYDLPFVYSILQDASFSGHLNIVSDSGEISGVSFYQGDIFQVDSDATLTVTSQKLISQGFINSEDLNLYVKSRKNGNLLKQLQESSYISPHALAPVRMSQMINELQNLVTAQRMRINVVSDRKIASISPSVDRNRFTHVLHDIITYSLPSSWLESFYKGWANHEIRVGPEYDANLPFVIHMPIISAVPDLTKWVQGSMTLEEILQSSPGVHEKIYKAIHLLALRRIVVFEESKKASTIGDLGARLQKIHEAIKDKEPSDIFRYFGAPKNVQPRDVERIYREFAKTFHPDKLPPGSPESIKKICHEVFSRVSSAQDVLTDETKRQDYQTQIKQKEAEKQIKSEKILDLGIAEIRKGDMQKAFALLSEANVLYPTLESGLYLLWSKLKLSKKISKEVFVAAKKQLEDVEVEDRKSSLYCFVNGLYLRLARDNAGALNYFKKSLEFDPKFLEARREFMALKAEIEASAPKDIFSADITELTSVVGSLFKKRK